MKNIRRRIWIDHLQTRLSLRISLYFIFYLLAMWAIVLVERSLSSVLSDSFHLEFGTGFLIFRVLFILALSLLFICDSIRYVHRLVGPLYRFRQTIRAITAGQEVDLVRLRNGDFLQELKDD